MRIPQKELHQQLRAEAIATRDKIAGMVRGYDSAKLNEHPEPKGWSIAEVLEHLCVSDEVYDEPVAALLRNSRPDAGAQAREWKPSLLGGFIAGALLKPTPRKAPKAFQPGPTARKSVAEVFLARELDFLKAMDNALQFDWRALRLGSPGLPSWAPKMNLGDGFRIHVVHVTRHSRQIERLVAKL